MNTQPERTPLLTSCQVRDVEQRNEQFVLFSLLVCLCCNPVFGLIGLLVGCSAKESLESEHYQRAVCLSKAGFIISLTGIIFTVIAVVLFSIYSVQSDNY